ncbi:MAG: PIN domain-containing protein [Sandaracinaceae bacterium]
MSCLVLDAAALAALSERRGKRQAEVRGALAAAFTKRRDVVVPALVLAELYRGARRSAQLDALLARETGFVLRSTDRLFARLVGGVLAAARASSGLMVEAHVVASAVERGGGVILTTDRDDLARLAAPYRGVVVVSIG